MAVAERDLAATDRRPRSHRGLAAQSVTIVAFDLGTCGGTLMYQAVEWFFPQHGQAFQANHYENVCTGTYVGQ